MCIRDRSHIGLARALAKDPKMRQRRRQIITAPAQVRSVGEAVFAAEDLLSIAKTQAESQSEERNAREKAELMRQLGMEEGQSPASHQRARIRELEEDQKRRSKRAIQDLSLIHIFQHGLPFFWLELRSHAASPRLASC